MTELKEEEKELINEIYNFFYSEKLEFSVKLIQRKFKLGYYKATEIFNEINKQYENKTI